MVEAPKPVIYRLDQQYLKGQDRPGYLQLFEDAGWEHASQMNNWQYFRRPEVAGAPQEIFADTASEAEKFRRVIPFAVIIGLLAGVQLNSSLYGRWPSIGLEIVQFTLFCVFLMLVYSLIRIGLRIRQLTKP